jgi:hypothetical protein
VMVGADKGYDTQEFLHDKPDRNETLHVSQNTHRLDTTAIDRRTTGQVGYLVRQREPKADWRSDCA